MPLNSNFISFDEPSLDKAVAGFEVTGNCSLRKSFAFPNSSTVFNPYSGKRFLLLDDPGAIRGGPGSISGERTEKAAAAACPLKEYWTFASITGSLTKGYDGAQLTCPDVSIKAGQSIGFFCRLGSHLFMASAWNDFAVFAAITHSGDFVHEIPICDTEGLQDPSGFTRVGRPHPGGWMAFSVPFNSAFKGTLVWTVANGQLVADRLQTVDDRAGCWPSCLAIDHITVAG